MRKTLAVFPFVLIGQALPAQVTTYIAPFGYQTGEGNSGNTIPWWSGSATYQQVHDAADLAAVFPVPVAIIKGLSFRKDASSSVGLTARTMDAQITLGATSVTASTMSGTFANNLGANPTLVLPYTNLSFPALLNVSTPNPQAWFYPFATPFPYLMTLGNLCWELRIKNSSSNVAGYNDAISSTAVPLFGSFLGTGCLATGQTSSSRIGARSLDFATGTLLHALEYARASSPAALCLGASAQVITVPGLCASFQTLPLLTLNGTTDAVGTWNSSVTFGSLLPYPAAKLFVQFAFLDTGLTHGFGVSPCSPITLPAPGAGSASRVWATTSGSGQGNETATTGTLGAGYCLVTGFDT